MIRDGLYRVETSYFVAGFVVKNGVVVRVAPILNRLLKQWKLIADWICN